MSASLPIGDYGLLADCNSAALVSRAGSVDWLCLPRYDSPALFARILDPDAGHWSIRPAGEFTARRRYLPGTLVMETTFTTDTGVVRLRDAMAFAPGQRAHDLGFDAPHELLRSVEGVSGWVELEMELAPRPEYGLVRPLLRLQDDGARSFGGPNRIGVRAGSPLTLDGATLSSSLPSPRASGAASRCAGRRSSSASHRTPPSPRRWPPGWTTQSRRGRRGKPSTTSTTAPTTSWCDSPRGCSRG